MALMSREACRKMKMLLSVYLWVWVGFLLLGGCSLLPPSKSEQAQATHERVLPEGWESISDWQPVNLDDDKEDENLLLFQFDNGQVGALILDGDPATSITPPQYLFPRYF